MDVFNEISFKTSKLITKKYSTSFSIAVSFLPTEMQQAIYSIYGFVRFADEIVDTFHTINKKLVLDNFERDYYDAMTNGISMNPVLNSFALTVKKYNIPTHLIDSFLKSMKADLNKQVYSNTEELNEYIYGSADVVGLMCLKIFVNGDEKLYNELQFPAKKLGSAFQKVNFLRDLKSDIENLDRRYFPEVTKENFSDRLKKEIVADIQKDFADAYVGIRKLPKEAKLPVVIAYYYYLRLLKKTKNTPANELITKRIRVSDAKKTILLVKSYLACKYRLV